MTHKLYFVFVAKNINFINRINTICQAVMQNVNTLDISMKSIRNQFRLSHESICFLIKYFCLFFVCCFFILSSILILIFSKAFVLCTLLFSHWFLEMI